jgi:hypothetical protein
MSDQPTGEPAGPPPASPWASPSGPAQDPARPRYGEYAPPGGAPAQPGPGPVPQPGAAWAPPPKPGLVPLRPMTLGTILGSSFQVLRRNPRPTFGAALLIQSAVSIVSVAITGVVTFVAIDRLSFSEAGDEDAILAGSIAAIALASLVPLALSLVAAAIVQGLIVLEVASGTVGERLRFGGLWRRARGRLGALAGWSLLVAVAVGLALAVVIGIIVAVVAFGGVAGAVAGTILGILAGLGAVVAFFWLTTRLAFVPSALVVERLGLRAAVVRSWTLSRGYFWRTLGIILLVSVILNVAGQVVLTPFTLIFAVVGGVFAPTGDTASLGVAFIVAYLVFLVAAVVVGAVSSVVSSATSGLLYIDLRMRREGLDLELARFVEARQAGASAPDPYRSTTPGRDPGAGPAPTGASPWA